MQKKVNKPSKKVVKKEYKWKDDYKSILKEYGIKDKYMKA